MSLRPSGRAPSYIDKKLKNIDKKNLKKTINCLVAYSCMYWTTFVVNKLSLRCRSIR